MVSVRQDKHSVKDRAEIVVTVNIKSKARLTQTPVSCLRGRPTTCPAAAPTSTVPLSTWPLAGKGARLPASAKAKHEVQNHPHEQGWGPGTMLILSAFQEKSRSSISYKNDCTSDTGGGWRQGFDPVSIVALILALTLN